MPTNPKGNIERLERILSAWKNLVPGKSFGGLTLEEFEALVNNSRNSRNQISELETQLKDIITQRDSNDQTALSKLQLVKNGVLADPTEGENSTVYEAMGYVRKDNKKSGLTRKRNVPVDPA